MLHRGHTDMIAKALALCGRVGLLIGSSQESGTYKNPFSYEVREGLLRLLFGNLIDIAPLPDIGVGNNATWGEYVLETAAEKFKATPDLLITGKEARRLEWFSCPKGQRIAELYVPKTIDISASKMREFLLLNDCEAWKRYADPRLWEQYQGLRAMMLRAQNNGATASI